MTSHVRNMNKVQLFIDIVEARYYDEHDNTPNFKYHLYLFKP